MALKNDLILRVAEGRPVPRPPVWLMRQAGRFLSEYRAVRAQAGSFKEMIRNPEYAAEVTLQPVDLIGVDAAIIFSDILVIPEAIGCDYDMVEKRGPVFPETIRSEADLRRLRPVEEGRNLEDTYAAIRMVKQDLDGRVPLIGFAGAPWTLFCYMTEGAGSKSFSIARRLLYTQPDFSRKLLDILTDATIHYLRRQVEAGVDILQVFDSWASMLGPEMYREFVIPGLERICREVQGVPKILFAKGANGVLSDLAKLDCQVLGIDWTISPEEAAALSGGKALQGNMDPCQLYASPGEVEQAVKQMLDRFPQGKHIVNLGHGILPDLPRESVKAFVETVKAFHYDADH